MTTLNNIKDYLKYLLKSHNLHGVHSPFIYDLNVNVLNQRVAGTELSNVNKYRNTLQHQKDFIDVEDLGRGSHQLRNRKRLISAIYATASCNKRMGEVLFQLIHHYDYKNILELGTCLGVGTAYIESALRDEVNAQITTIEGSSSLHDFTQTIFHSVFKENKVHFVCGNFDSVLQQVVSNIAPIDLVLIDGNHTYAATIHYFNILVSHLNHTSVLIFDDIYWSSEMKRAWQEIKLHPEVTCTVDLFRWGLVFFRKEMQKEHFTLRFDGFLQAHIG